MQSHIPSPNKRFPSLDGWPVLSRSKEVQGRVRRLTPTYILPPQGGGFFAVARTLRYGLRPILRQAQDAAQHASRILPPGLTGQPSAHGYTKRAVPTRDDPLFSQALAIGLVSRPPPQGLRGAEPKGHIPTQASKAAAQQQYRAGLRDELLFDGLNRSHLEAKVAIQLIGVVGLQRYAILGGRDALVTFAHIGPSPNKRFPSLDGRGSGEGEKTHPHLHPPPSRGRILPLTKNPSIRPARTLRQAQGTAWPTQHALLVKPWHRQHCPAVKAS